MPLPSFSSSPTAAAAEGVCERCEEGLSKRLQEAGRLNLVQPSKLRPLIVGLAEEFEMPVRHIVTIIRRLLTTVFEKEMSALDQIEEDPD